MFFLCVGLLPNRFNCFPCLKMARLTGVEFNCFNKVLSKFLCVFLLSFLLVEFFIFSFQFIFLYILFWVTIFLKSLTTDIFFMGFKGVKQNISNYFYCHGILWFKPTAKWVIDFISQTKCRDVSHICKELKYMVNIHQDREDSQSLLSECMTLIVTFPLREQIWDHPCQ